MTHVGYLLAGWGITLLAFAVYAARLIVRGRRLSERVSPAHRRWMESPGVGSD